MDRPENLSLRDKIEWIIKELRKLKRGCGGSSPETNPGLGAVTYNNDYNSLSNKPDLSLKADLVGGKVPASQLPAYVDDVLEFANLASFPATGESGKIYIALDTNLTYRWGGSSYVVMSSSLALGETESTAYRGDRGKIAYDHSQITGNPHNTTKADIGLGNVDNTSDLNKPISTATQNALNTKANIDDIPSKTSFTYDILVSNWSLVSGKYEAVISNAGILANSFVDVIPSNDHVDIVRDAQIYPSVLISEGSVKVYSKFLPSGTISVTVNII